MGQKKNWGNLDVDDPFFAENVGVVSAKATLRQTRKLHSILTEVKDTNPEHNMERKLLAIGFKRKADGVGFVRAAPTRATVVMDCFGTLDVSIEKNNGVGARVSMELDGAREITETVTIGGDFSATRQANGRLTFAPEDNGARSFMNVDSIFA